MKERMTREELAEQIKLCRQALMYAGPVHYRDLQKHIRRMEAQIKQYDRFMADAQQKVV